MQGNIDIVTLLSLVVAIIVILKLRSVLGRRTNEDEARIDRQMRRALMFILQKRVADIFERQTLQV